MDEKPKLSEKKIEEGERVTPQIVAKATGAKEIMKPSKSNHFSLGSGDPTDIISLL